MQTRVPSLRPARDFAPVPRKYRHDGWTVERQRAFIAALAETGSVRAAAHRINMASEGAYALRRSPGAEEFAAAWADALDHGVQSLVDIAIDRARDGVAVPVFWKGEQVGERRWYNDRLLMFILRHHLPAKYGALAALPPGTKHPDTVAREAEEAKAEAAAKMLADMERSRQKTLDLYRTKVQLERRARLEGRVVEADLTLRQLTHLELVLVTGVETTDLIDYATGHYEAEHPDHERFADPISDTLAAAREEIWAKLGDPPRPPVRRPRLSTSPACQYAHRGERKEAQTRALAMMAEAQALWEATVSDASWAKWCGGYG